MIMKVTSVVRVHFIENLISVGKPNITARAYLFLSVSILQKSEFMYVLKLFKRRRLSLCRTIVDLL
jgi:hypothetical protein